MSKIVLKMVTLVLERVKRFVFDAPSSSASSCNVIGIFFANLNIGNPSVVVDFPLFINHPILKKIQRKV